MAFEEWSQIKRQSLEKIKVSIRLYSKVTVLYQGKMIKGTVVGIDLKGIKLKENLHNHTYKWKYILGVDTD